MQPQHLAVSTWLLLEAFNLAFTSFRSVERIVRRELCPDNYIKLVQFTVRPLR